MFSVGSNHIILRDCGVTAKTQMYLQHCSHSFLFVAQVICAPYSILLLLVTTAAVGPVVQDIIGVLVIKRWEDKKHRNHSSCFSVQFLLDTWIPSTMILRGGARHTRQSIDWLTEIEANAN